MNWSIFQHDSYLKEASCFAFIAMTFLAGGNVAAQVGQTPTLLYVLDTGEGWFEHAQILQLDTKSGRIRKAFAVGDNPDMALSPDESRLYVTSVTRDPDDGDLVESWLSVYDTPSGRLLDRVSNPDAMGHTLPVYGSEMAVSPSGRWLYITKFHYNPERSYYFYLAAFDTVNREFLPHPLTLPCQDAAVMPAREDLNVVLVCRNGPVFDVNLGDSATPMKRVALQPPVITGPIAKTSPCDMGASIVPPRLQEAWGAVFLLPGADKVALVSDSEGSIFSFDRTAGTSAKVGQDPRLRAEGINRGLVSQNEDAVYFQTGPNRRFSNDQSFSGSTQVVIADPSTLSFKFALKTTKPFFTMALSKDGYTLFTVNPDTATIGVIDISTITEVREIHAVGKRPISAIAAP